MPLFLHSGALGDFLLSLPLLRALRTALPEAEWTLAAHEEYAHLVSTIFPFRRRISPGGAELLPLSTPVLDGVRIARLAVAHGGLTGFVRRAREVEAVLSSHAIGLPVLLGEPLAAEVPSGRSIEEVLGDILSRVGGGGSALGPRDFAIDPAELPPLLPSGDVLRFLGGVRPERLAFIHPGAGDGRKTAPLLWYDEVRRGLERQGLTVAWLRGPVESERMDTFPLQPVVEGADLVQVAHAVSRAVLYVGNDTGPTHLASALGVPTLAVHARANHAWRPRGRCTAVVSGRDAFPEASLVVEEAFRLLEASRTG